MWIKTVNSLPPDEIPVLIILNGEVRIGELRWDNPSWEETYEVYRYWDDPNDDGQEWQWDDVQYWAVMPVVPKIVTVNNIHKLTGHSRVSCVEALNVCNWNEHRAIEFIKGGRNGKESLNVKGNY